MEFHEAIECAIRTDGRSPASDYLAALKAGAWIEDPMHAPPADDNQIYDYARLLANIEYVGIHGEPRSRTSVNYLEDGIWEFKHANRRLTYWDTLGDGTYTPKALLDDLRTLGGSSPESDFWWYPDMDGVLRLGCAWDKDDQMAPPAMIDEAIHIRDEDCAHDR